jgi:phosphoribosylformimino-5-aminoimidazole carboxamide ribotide isomerase
MEIWPAIDLRHGKCVRLRQGDYSQETVFGEDPAAMARRWVDAGARRLHLVDLDAARGEPSDANRDAVCAIVDAVKVPCQLGGGVRGDGAIRSLLSLGLRRLIVGSAALKNPGWFATAADAYPDRLAAGIDARGGMVATDGWIETSSTCATELAQDLRRRTSSISAIIYTDIARDGMMAGPNVEALREMELATDIPVIASGGVTTMDDVRMLAESGTFAAIIGRAIYEGTIDLAEAVAISER